MKNLHYYLLLALVLFMIGLYFYDRNKPVIQHNDNEEILLELRSLKDSLLNVVESYDTPNTEQINNYYNTKYENEIKIISSNNVDSNIVFFSKWYLSVRQRD